VQHQDHFGYYYPLFTSQKTGGDIRLTEFGGAGKPKHTRSMVTRALSMDQLRPPVKHKVPSQAFKMYVTPNTTAATATAIIQGWCGHKNNVTGIGANYTATPTGSDIRW
jgi:hypothetical protein